MAHIDPDAEDTTIYTVVVNDEEQYSIWPEWRDLPAGWRTVGTSGPKADCLAYIETVWTDMRPLSLRRAMERASAIGDPPPPPPPGPDPEDESLPLRLSRGEHAVELSFGPERTYDALKRQLETGYLHVRFTGTRGGTELGFKVVPETLERLEANLGAGERTFRFSGGLTLDYTQVNCIADIDLSTFTGSGRLELV